jgi:hypothetical protein
MPRLPHRLVIATTWALALSAGAPALTQATSAHADPVKAKTALVAKISSETGDGIGVSYRASKGGQLAVDPLLPQTAVSASNAAYDVDRVHAGSAQLPAKLEWLLGVDIQISGDHRLDKGSYDIVYHHAASGRRLFAQGLADYRLSNYYIGQADTLLGVRHPRLSAAPYRAYKNKPGPSTKPVTPTMSVTAKLSLAETVRMGAAAIAERIPEHLYLSDQYSLLGPNETACQYYSVLVGRMHVTRAQRAAKRGWVTGVSAQRLGDDMLFRGLYHREASRAADRREANAGLATLRRADSEIGHVDATLGVHRAGPSARLPRRLVLGN